MVASSGLLSLKVAKVYGTSAQNQAAIAGSGNRLVYTAGSGVVSISLDNSAVSSRSFSNYPPKQLTLDTQTGKLPWEKAVTAPFIIGNPAGSPTKESNTESSASSKAKNKLNTISCVAVSPQNVIATGEEGYLPRVLIFGMSAPNSSGVIAVIQEHQFGISKIGFSPSGNLLATLGTPNDGYIYIWSVNPRGATPVTICSSNRCISQVNDMQWLSESQLVTVGVRHIRVWTINDTSRSPGGTTTLLDGRNIILGEAIKCTFQACVPLPFHPDGPIFNFLVASTSGDIFRISDAGNLVSVTSVGHAVVSMCRHEDNILVAGAEKITWISSDTFEKINVITRPNSGVASLEDTVVYLNEGAIYGLDTQINLSGTSLRGIKLYYDEDKILSWQGQTLQTWSRDFTLLEESVNNFEVETVFSLNDSTLVLGSTEGTVTIAGKEFKAHGASVTAIDGHDNMFFTASRDRRIQIWRYENSDWILFQTVQLPSPITKATLCGQNIIVYTVNKTLQFYAPDDDGLYASIKTISLKWSVQDLLVNATEDTILAATNDKQVITYGQQGQVISSFYPIDVFGERVGLGNLALCDVGGCTYIAGTASDKSVTIYSYPEGVLASHQFAHAEPSAGLIWHPKLGKLISTGECVFVYDALPQTPPSSPKRVLRAATSPAKPASPARSPSPVSRTRPIPISRPLASTGSSSRLSLTPPGPRPASPLRVTRPPHSVSRAGSPPPRLASPMPRSSLRLSDPIQNLETALKAFLSEDVDAEKAKPLEPLLIDALNRIDRLALVNKFSKDLLDHLKNNK